MPVSIDDGRGGAVTLALVYERPGVSLALAGGGAVSIAPIKPLPVDPVYRIAFTPSAALTAIGAATQARAVAIGAASATQFLAAVVQARLAQAQASTVVSATGGKTDSRLIQFTPSARVDPFIEGAQVEARDIRLTPAADLAPVGATVAARSAQASSTAELQPVGGRIVARRMDISVSAATDFVGEAVSAAFDPADLFTGGRLGAIYDPNNAGSVSTTDGRLTSIADRSPNANLPLAQDTASAQPLFGSDANGNYWEQDHKVTWLQASTRLGLAANPDLEIWGAVEIVNNATLADADNGFLNIGNGDDNSITASIEDSNIGGFRFFGGNALFPRSINPAVFTWSRDAGSTYGDSEFAEDGTEKTASSIGNGTGSPASTVADIRTVNDVASNNGDAVIRYHALIILGFRTTPTERANLLTWMGNKLGKSL